MLQPVKQIFLFLHAQIDVQVCVSIHVLSRNEMILLKDLQEKTSAYALSYPCLQDLVSVLVLQISSF